MPLKRALSSVFADPTGCGSGSIERRCISVNLFQFRLWERERVGGDRTFIGITMIMMARLILRHPMTGYIIYTMLAQISIN